MNPGYVDTDSMALHLDDEAGRQSPVAFLCSPEASWMQGQILYLDGGIFLHAPGRSVRWWRQTDVARADGLRPRRGDG